MVRVLSHIGGADQLGLPADLATQVEVVALSPRRPVPDDLTGDVLVSHAGASASVAELLDRGVRWVHYIGTGIDGFPLDRLGPGCVLTNSRGVSGVPIAEWVLACMLAVEKELPETWVGAPVHDRRDLYAQPLGTLQGATLALIGLGGIGTEIATRARAFAMDVRALRRRPEPSPVPGVEVVSDRFELVEGADHVVVVAPLTDATRGIVDRALFEAMTPGVHLVNVARGPLVVSDDLRAALDDGIVACASLDVTDPEPLPDGHWMFEHPKVRLLSLIHI